MQCQTHLGSSGARVLKRRNAKGGKRKTFLACPATDVSHSCDTTFCSSSRLEMGAAFHVEPWEPMLTRRGYEAIPVDGCGRQGCQHKMAEVPSRQLSVPVHNSHG